jgi:hypothetical protein
MFLKSSNLFDMYTMHIYIYLFIMPIVQIIYGYILYYVSLSLSLFRSLYALYMLSLSRFE